MNGNIEKLPLNATVIKLAAVCLMVLDHIHQMFEPLGAPIWLNWLGRPVLPLFLFILSESYYHTANRKKLLLRLLFASWFMQVGDVLLGTVFWPNEQVLLFNNAFATLFMAGLYMLFRDLYLDGAKTKKTGKIAAAAALSLLPVLTVIPVYLIIFHDLADSWLNQVLLTAALMLPNILFVEGGPSFILLGVLFYTFRGRRQVQILILAIISGVFFLFYKDAANQWLMILAAIPILLYNGKKGRGWQYFFYVFYPVHIYLFYIIATIWTKRVF